MMALTDMVTPFTRTPISNGIGGTVTWPNMSPGAYVVVIEGWGYSEGEYALAFGCPPGGTNATVSSTAASVRSTTDRGSPQTEDGTVTSVAVTVVRMVSICRHNPFLCPFWPWPEMSISTCTPRTTST